DCAGVGSDDSCSGRREGGAVPLPSPVNTRTWGLAQLALDALHVDVDVQKEFFVCDLSRGQQLPARLIEQRTLPDHERAVLQPRFDLIDPLAHPGRNG